jgi:SHS2 domain-containing protein
VVPGGQYEYLPHTADVQLHSWGSSLASALEHLALAMFGYMVDDLGEFEPKVAIPDEGGGGDAEVDGGGIVVTARDAHTLVFSFLDEWLVHFHLTQLVPRRVQVLELRTGEGGGGWGLTTRGRGEKLDLKRHKQGTEVKAITYSAMRVLRGGEKGEYEIFVIIDI